LKYVDPSGHEAAPQIDWGQVQREGLKVIEGGAKGAEKGKSGGIWGAILGTVLGALLGPNHAGESQEDIDNMKAGYFNLPLITPESLEKLKEEAIGTK